MKLDRFLQTSLTVLSCLVYCIIIIIYDGGLLLQFLSLIYLFLLVSVVQCFLYIKIIISEIILGCNKCCLLTNLYFSCSKFNPYGDAEFLCRR